MTKVGENSNKGNIDNPSNQKNLGKRKVSITKDSDISSLNVVSGTPMGASGGDLLLEVNVNVTEGMQDVLTLFDHVPSENIEDLEKSILDTYFPELDHNPSGKEMKPVVKELFEEEIRSLIEEGKSENTTKNMKSIFKAAVLLFVSFLKFIMGVLVLDAILTYYQYVLLFLISILGVLIIVRAAKHTVATPFVFFEFGEKFLGNIFNDWQSSRLFLRSLFNSDSAESIVSLARYRTGVKLGITSRNSADILVDSVKKVFDYV